MNSKFQTSGKWSSESEAMSIGNTKEQHVLDRKRRIEEENQEVVAEPTTLFRCSYCGVQFAKRWGLEVHMRSCSEKH